jgi:hypothetical protein
MCIHIQLLALEHFNWELSDHPPYSSDLAPSDYHLFTHLKNWVQSKHFNNNKKLMEGVKTFKFTIRHRSVCKLQLQMLHFLTKSTPYLNSVYQGSPLEEEQRKSQTLKKVSK